MFKVLPSKIFTFPTFQCYLENPASLNACFPFFTPFFISDFIKFQLIPVGISWLVSKSNIMDHKLVGINQMKLLI